MGERTEEMAPSAELRPSSQTAERALLAEPGRVGTKALHRLPARRARRECGGLEGRIAQGKAQWR
eukprot:7249741-Prymnesium_polylepis.2